ncbi:MAG: hypothetical protein INR71_11385, partial [Terriglobus roseus]|nr:hypothetical protein [Terriglobus roseus]
MSSSTATFSYAQAAKGLAAPIAGPAQSPKLSSDVSSTAEPQPLEAAAPTQGVEKSIPADAEPSTADSASLQDSASTVTPSKMAPTQAQKAASPYLNGVSPPASPDYGVSSTSTLVKEDDQSSAVPTSTDSTWDIKSQASMNVENAGDQSDVSDKERKEQNKDAAPSKPLHEAPPPMVNIWKKRAEARAAVVPAPAKSPASPNPEAAPASVSEPNGNTSQVNGVAKSQPADATTKTASRERKNDPSKTRNQSEPRNAQSRREARPGDDSSKP